MGETSKGENVKLSQFLFKMRFELATSRTPQGTCNLFTVPLLHRYGNVIT